MVLIHFDLQETELVLVVLYQQISLVNCQRVLALQFCVVVSIVEASLLVLQLSFEVLYFFIEAVFLQVVLLLPLPQELQLLQVQLVHRDQEVAEHLRVLLQKLLLNDLFF